MGGSRSPSSGPSRPIEQDPRAALVEPEGSSGDEDDKSKKPKVINDSTQYSAYQYILKRQEDESYYADLSFPVSENSMECKLFQAHHEGILSRLNDEKSLHWRSVECLGRVLNGKEIRTTVVITCRARLEEKRERDLIDSLQALGQNTAKSMAKFPFVFVKGKITRCLDRQPDRLAFMDKQHPLVCGASCGTYIGRNGTGTIGGFVTIEGDPDEGAVYAITNHHVAVPDSRDPVPWMGFGTADDLLRWHSDVPTELGARQESLSELLDIRRSLDSSEYPYPRHYGTDSETYVLALTTQFLQLQADPAEKRERRLERVQQRLMAGGETHNLQASLLKSNLEDLSDRLRRDMIMSVDTPAHVIAAFVDGIFDVPSNVYWGHAKSTLVALLDQRNVARLLDTWLHDVKPGLIVHPSQSDCSTILERLKEDRDHLRRGDGQLLASNIDRPNEASELREQIRNAKDQADNPSSRIIGIVWASSGLGPRGDWSGSCLQEDWALIKLFRADQQQFSNSFSKSPLRLNEAADHFRAVKPWSNPASVAVWKRGRTSNVTIGRSNGVTSSINLDGNYTQEYSVLPPADALYRAFTMGGDSGSWVMDRFGQLVGMVWGGSSSTRTAYFTPAEYLFKWIELEFMTAMDLTPVEDFEPGKRIKLFGTGG
ncbi:hypothetical protein QBC37DRAFT_104880 [Rhypophila decipiens]|uniref:Uncharacterized protein n=1 Tax=Rhypophila decipiens TaxID=261697 RepID=A0AAN6XUS8_9PEZI|nr:hypothetical protein QBC37DRAFT_104880 [Rhypophila decipiens]